MVVFHAAMAESALGHDEAAEAHLEKFFAMYAPIDMWQERAMRALVEIRSHVAPSERHVHFRE